MSAEHRSATDTSITECVHCGRVREEPSQTFCRAAGCGRAYAKPRTWKDDMKTMAASRAAAECEARK